MDRWRRLASERIQDCRVFEIDRVRFAPPEGGDGHDFFVLNAPAWVNVIALTDAREVVLVRQFRFGVDEVTLEIPGGMCDAGEDPALAAARELREETGYVAGELVSLGWVQPNPALQNNRCYHFLATAARLDGEQMLDSHERIEVLTVPLEDIPRLICDGEIRHSLVVSAFHLLSLRRPVLRHAD